LTRTPLEIAAADARRLLLSVNGLARDPGAKLGPGGLQALIEDLGFVQVDSINMVERAHHMILFSRNQTYRPRHLDRLLERERVLFENWTHDASVIPTSFYRFWKHRFSREEERLAQRFRQWFDNGFEDQLEGLLERVRSQGEIRSRDLADEEVRRQRGWWDWHAGKTALEYLWLTGRLSVARREGFQKVYDLAERVIPQTHLEAVCAHDEVVDWACRSALERLGFGTPGSIARFWDLVGAEDVKAWLEGPGADATRPVLVHAFDGGKPRKLVALDDVDDRLAAAPAAPARLRVLSPFDPLLRDRARLEWAFGFDYRIEIFVPAAQRAYGYYIFPILEGDRLVGRIDMKANRAAAMLDVTAVWPERGVTFGRQRRARLEAELERIRRFAGLAGVRIESSALERDPMDRAPSRGR
jgi:hypothetical protein